MECRAADVQARDHVHDREAHVAASGSTGRAAATPSASQKRAASGEPPKSAAPAIAPPMHGEPAQRHVGLLAPRLARPRPPAGDDRVADRQADEHEEDARPRRARARRAPDPRSAAGSACRSPAGSSAAAGRGSARARRGCTARSRRAAARPPSRCRRPGCRGRRGRRCRRRSAGGSSSRRTGPGVSGGGPNQDWRKPSSALRSAVGPGRHRGADQHGDDDGAAAQVAAHERERDHRHGAEIEAEHARQRRAEDDPEPRRRRSRRARRPGGRRSRSKRYASPSTSAIVESAARSCSPMNDPCRLPPLTTNSTAPQATATVQKATRNPARSANRRRVSTNAAAPSASTAKSDSLPGRRDGAGRVRDRADDDQQREGRDRAEQPGRGDAAAEPELAATASTAVTSSAGSAGPIETVVPPTPTSRLGRSAARNRQRPRVTRKT